MSRGAYVWLLCLALAQMLFSVAELEGLAALAAATAASPAPKVFTSRGGLESFSSAYELVLVDAQGSELRVAFDKARYALLRGPYNRRNVYGALLAFAPGLVENAHARAMFESITQRALCGEAPLLAELGLPHAAWRALRIVQRPRPGTRTALPLTVRVSCS